MEKKITNTTIYAIVDIDGSVLSFTCRAWAKDAKEAISDAYGWPWEKIKATGRKCVKFKLQPFKQL